MFYETNENNYGGEKNAFRNISSSGLKESKRRTWFPACCFCAISGAGLVSPKVSLFLQSVPVGLMKDTVSLWNLPFYQGITSSTSFGSGQSYLVRFIICRHGGTFAPGLAKPGVLLTMHGCVCTAQVDHSLGMVLFL